MRPKKSTGPTSLEGKKKVSQNAVRLGAYSKTVVLPGESPEEFEALCAEFERDLNPQDIPGKTIVRQMAGLAWKLMRLEKVETQAITHLLSAPLKEEEIADTQYLWQKPVQIFLPCIPNLDIHDIPKIVHALSYIQGIQELESTPELMKKIQKECPYLDEILNTRVPQAQIASDPTKIDPKMTWVTVAGKAEASWQESIQAAVEELKTRLWFHMHRNEIIKEYQAIKVARLLAFMERLTHGRVLTYLNREFALSLSRYRAHEEWRKDNRTINMGGWCNINK